MKPTASLRSKASRCDMRRTMRSTASHREALSITLFVAYLVPMCIHDDSRDTTTRPNLGDLNSPGDRGLADIGDRRRYPPLQDQSAERRRGLFHGAKTAKQQHIIVTCIRLRMRSCIRFDNALVNFMCTTCVPDVWYIHVDGTIIDSVTVYNTGIHTQIQTYFPMRCSVVVIGQKYR